MTPVIVRWSLLLLAAGGFALAALWGGMWLGGAVALGRSDTALAIPTLMVFALCFGVLAVPRTGAGPSVAGIAAFGALSVAVIVTGADGYWPPYFLLAAAVALAIALFAAQRALRWHRAAQWGLLGACAVLWWFGSHVLLARAYLPSAAMQPGRTVMVTGLPLINWPDPASSVGPREDAAMTMLRALLARPLVLADDLAAGMLTADDRLLLAHPQALPPEALVEIDRFVRAGGRAVILADGLSGWPPPHGFGDPRNPPVTSLLTPLLDHWGIALAAPVPGDAATGAVHVRHGKYQLALHSAGQFDRLPSGCRGTGPLASGKPTIATCRIGRGTVVLLADADLLYTPLWQSAPGWARHLRPSDNLEWVANQLEGRGESGFWGLRPTWRAAAAD